MILIAGGRIGGYAVRIHGAEATGQVVLVERKRVYFDFDERFGPLVVDPQGEPMKRQPIREDHPFWEPFEAWLAGYWKAKMDGALDAYLDAHHGTRQRVTPRHGSAHRVKAAQSIKEQPLIPSEASTAALATDESILPSTVRGEEDHG